MIRNSNNKGNNTPKSVPTLKSFKDCHDFQNHLVKKLNFIMDFHGVKTSKYMAKISAKKLANEIWRKSHNKNKFLIQQRKVP